MKAFVRRLLVASVGLPLAGCAAAGGATQGIGQLLGLALGLAAIAAPIALSYYLYKRND